MGRVCRAVGWRGGLQTWGRVCFCCAEATGCQPTRPPLLQDWIPVKDNGAIAGAAAKEVTKALEEMGSDGHLATTDTASAQGALTFIRVGVAGQGRGLQGKRGTAPLLLL